MNTSRRTRLMTLMDLRDLVRRPLILVLLVVTPLVFISRSIAGTEPLPRSIRLADGAVVATTMRELHGADMVLIAVAFLAGLIGVFIMNAAREADGRLARAGLGATPVVAARLVVLVLCTAVVTTVALAVTARDFGPRHWGPFAVAVLAAGLTYAAVGAITGATLGRVPATYLLLFVTTLDIGIVQNPMFTDGSPPAWAALLPGSPTTAAAMAAAFGTTPIPFGVIAGTAAWLGALWALTIWRLRRPLGTTSTVTSAETPLSPTTSEVP